MLQLLTVKKLCVVLAVIALSYGFGMQSTFAVEEVVKVPPTRASTTKSLTMRQPTGGPQKEEMVLLVRRIEALERQLDSMHMKVELNRTMGNIAREAKELASDAWTLAVEARAIAVRAEGKAEQAQRNKTQ